jgi:hypothetical protein
LRLPVICVLWGAMIFGVHVDEKGVLLDGVVSSIKSRA